MKAPTSFFSSENLSKHGHWHVVEALTWLSGQEKSAILNFPTVPNWCFDLSSLVSLFAVLPCLFEARLATLHASQVGCVSVNRTLEATSIRVFVLTEPRLLPLKGSWRQSWKGYGKVACWPLDIWSRVKGVKRWNMNEKAWCTEMSRSSHLTLVCSKLGSRDCLR